MVRMPAQQPFRNLDKPIHTAGSLQDSRASHGRNDDVNNIRWRLTRLHAKAKHQNGKADAGNGSERKAPVTRTYIKRQKHHQQLNNHQCHIISLYTNQKTRHIRIIYFKIRENLVKKRASPHMQIMTT